MSPATREMIFIYGPPGSGKSSLGCALAEALEIPFWDLDAEIEAYSGVTIPGLFEQVGESGFRQQEQAALSRIIAGAKGVVALGGGALLNPQNRALVESLGVVICLNAQVETLSARLEEQGGQRPLLAGDMQQKLSNLLAERGRHYASFPVQLDTDAKTVLELAWEAQVCLGRFRIRNMGDGYDVRVQAGGIDHLGELFAQKRLGGPLMIVSDKNIAHHYADRIMSSLRGAGYTAYLTIIPAGEGSKNIQTASHLWGELSRAGLERGSTVIALGGGVVSDLAGFVAATYLRGLAWVVVPTSLLAMVDASLGGKTGIDLPVGKNLVGAFYPPRLVLADPHVLHTLPEVEIRSGMAEVIKHAVIGSTQLFQDCSDRGRLTATGWEQVVRRGMAVKVRLVQEDPYEGGLRAALNLGHTLGHAIELCSDYSLRHGEAVAIGMVAAARLSERLGLAKVGFYRKIEAILQEWDLPVQIPNDLNRGDIIQAMELDKKRRSGSLRFVLPVRVGEVKVGMEIANWKELIFE